MRIYRQQDFQGQLDLVKPLIGNYGWMWALLSARFRLTHRFPYKLHRMLRRYVNPRRPYFTAKTADGVAYVGDARDEPSVTHQLLPASGDHISNFIRERMGNTPTGAYLDVGSNLGIVASTVAIHLAGQEQVIAFEPMPETARRAAAGFALNNLSNVQLLETAVGDENIELSFFNLAGNSAGASAHPSNRGGDGWIETKVSCRTLDSLVEDGIIGNVGFIKIDVEGHEPQTVRGARKLIERHRPPIVYEYHYSIAPGLGWTPSHMEAIINEAGPYRFRVLNEDGSLTEQVPTDHPGYIDFYCEAVRDATGNPS